MVNVYRARVCHKHHVVVLCLLRKAETSCDEDPNSEPPKVLKIFNRSLLFDAVSRGDPGALEGLLEYLQSQQKRLTDEEFRGETWKVHGCHLGQISCLSHRKENKEQKYGSTINKSSINTGFPLKQTLPLYLWPFSIPPPTSLSAVFGTEDVRVAVMSELLSCQGGAGPGEASCVSGKLFQAYNMEQREITANCCLCGRDQLGLGDWK